MGHMSLDESRKYHCTWRKSGLLSLQVESKSMENLVLVGLVSLGEPCHLVLM